MFFSSYLYLLRMKIVWILILVENLGDFTGISYCISSYLLGIYLLATSTVFAFLEMICQVSAEINRLFSRRGNI
jgi:hypothetical protein